MTDTEEILSHDPTDRLVNYLLTSVLLVSNYIIVKVYKVESNLTELFDNANYEGIFLWDIYK